MTTREEIVALDKRLLWHPYTPMKRYIDEVDPLVVERAEGIYLWDVRGNRYVDGNSSWWVSVLGHNHPRLMEALRIQTETLAQCSMAGTVHEGAARVAERVLPMCGDSYTPDMRPLAMTSRQWSGLLTTAEPMPATWTIHSSPSVS